MFVGHVKNKFRSVGLVEFFDVDVNAIKSMNRSDGSEHWDKEKREVFMHENGENDAADGED